MDGVVLSLVFGKLRYPCIDWRVVPSVKPNHKSWEQQDVKAVLGLKIGTGLFQGALEWVDPRLPKPIIIEPKGEGTAFATSRTPGRATNRCQSGRCTCTPGRIWPTP